MYWEQFIRQCPFVPTITENEYELYHDFILSDDFEMEEDYYYQWQKYDEYKTEYNNVGSGSTMPEWYQFYDSRMGTGALLILPDVRGEKEDFYIKLYFDNDKKENPGKWAVKEDPDKRPVFKYYEPKVLEAFIDAFESNNIKDTYRAMQSTMDENLEHDEKLLKAIEILKQAGDIELTYAGNWWESILQSARNYEKECLHKSFTAAYNNYLNLISMGIGFDSELSDDNINHITSLVKIFKDQILKGRVLNNEPADFNF